MSKRKRDVPGLSLDDIIPGFRCTRSAKEFSPFANRAADIIVDDVDPVQLVTAGHLSQELAMDNGETDEVETPAVRIRPVAHSQTLAQVHPLSSLLAPCSLPARPEPLPYVADMSLEPSQRKKAKAKHHEREKRRITRWEEQWKAGSPLKAVARKKILVSSSQAIVVSYKSSKSSKSTGWTGPKNIPQKYRVKILSVTDALSFSGLKMTLWDDSRQTRLIRAKDGMRWAVLGGHPGPGWKDTVQGVDRLFVWASEQFSLPPKFKNHRRGKYETFGGGVSFGNGRTEPGGFKMTQKNAAVFQKVLENPDMQKLARYCDQLLFSYFPRVHALLTNLLDKIVNADDELKKNFPGCCYAAFYLNMNSVGTEPHNDVLNAFFTGCAVGSIGPYDYKRGGHLILWDLGLVIEFPSGCVIILPSALITHSNIPIGPNERRHSAAFFTAAGLLSWYYNGFMSDKEFISRASMKQLNAWKSYRGNLWKMGLEMLQGD